MTLLTNKNTPPGPKGNLFLGNAISLGLSGLSKKTIDYMRQSALDYGDIVSFRVLNYQFLFVNNPAYIKYILQNNYSNYSKSSMYEVMKQGLGNGLLNSEGAFWLQQRRLYQPAFNKESILHYANSVVECTNKMINRWEVKKRNREILNLSQEILKLAFDVVGRTMYSTYFSVEQKKIDWKSVVYTLDYVNKLSKNHPFNLPIKFPTPGNLRFNKALKTLNKTTYEIIEKRRKENKEYNDLLSALMSTPKQGTGEKMNDKELRDEIFTIFSAGHETTSNGLIWTLYLLSQHSEIESKLHKELEEVLGNETPTYEDLTKLKYTTQIVYESLRLYPPAWSVGRRSIEEDEIGGYRIPKGIDIAISPYILHRHPDFWDNPEVFDPNRFSSENRKKITPFSYIPFGGGPHVCVGQNFAIMELILVIAMIAKQFRLRIKDNQKVEIDPCITLRPLKEVFMTIQERN